MSDRDRCRADDEDGEGPAEAKDPEEEKCKGCAKKGKRMSFFRLRKSKKVKQKQKQRGFYVNSGCWGGRVGGGGWCCFCVKQPTTLVDSPGESPSSDPNSSEFTFDMLRALIENNDFYSKECNPHLDADDAYVRQNTNIQN